MVDPFPSPLVLGHRGAPHEALENTLQSFARALELGADGVELDVQRARDGVPVVIHDDTLDRTLSVAGAVAAHPWPALERLTGARLPSLQQAVAWAAASGAWLNVELKAAGVEDAALSLLRGAGILSRAFLSSFDPEIVAEVGRLAPQAARFLLVERWDETAAEGLSRSGATGLCLRVDAASPLALQVLRERGVPVVVWTVDDPERMRALLHAGVAGIITNRPEVGARVRAEVTGRP